MNFITFNSDGHERAGVLLANESDGNAEILDLAHSTMTSALGGAPPNLQALIESGLPTIVQRLSAHVWDDAAKLPLNRVTLQAPLPRPRRIFGIAHNYRDALAERGMQAPSEPVLFTKDPRTVIGPMHPIVLPAGIGGVTYEAELAVVIGTTAANLSAEAALDHVVAFGCFNDISASDIIKADGKFDRGKNFPTFGPFGPFLATRDELGDLHDLSVSLTVDGKTLQNGTTRNMLFDVSALISLLSHRFVLEPGDIIATGTPAGVAALHKPPAWLMPGSTVAVEVQGLGRLANPIVEGPAAHD